MIRSMIRHTALVLCMSMMAIGCKQNAETPAAKDATAVKESASEAMSGAAEASAPASDATKNPAKTADAKGDSPSLKINFLSGEAYDLAARRGRWVVLNFWATWCAPCLKEMPELDAYDGKRDDLEVVGLAYEEITPEDMRAFLEKRPVNYPIAIVDVYDPPAAFGTPRGLPMTYLIAPDGRIAERFMGPITGADIDTAIEMHQRAGGAANAAAGSAAG
jgi:thiol-disulfide isomerase/thioredoxin